MHETPISALNRTLNLRTMNRPQKLSAAFDENRPNLGFAIMSSQEVGDRSSLPVFEVAYQWGEYCKYHYGSVTIGDDGGITAFNMLDRSFDDLSTLEQLKKLLSVHQDCSDPGKDKTNVLFKERKTRPGCIEVKVMQYARSANEADDCYMKVIGLFEYNSADNTLR